MIARPAMRIPESRNSSLCSNKTQDIPEQISFSPISTARKAMPLQPHHVLQPTRNSMDLRKQIVSLTLFSALSSIANAQLEEFGRLDTAKEIEVGRTFFDMFKQHEPAS